MKCRICGYDLDPGTAFCPFCGSRTGDISGKSQGSMFESPEIKETPRRRKMAEEEEFNWNTYDFPKPRELRDIKMEWSGAGMMNNDASEGFVSSVQKPADPRTMPTWQMPEQQPMPDPQIWFSQIAPGTYPGNLPPQTQQFTATGYVQTHPIQQSSQAPAAQAPTAQAPASHASAQVPSSPVIKSFEEAYPASAMGLHRNDPAPAKAAEAADPVKEALEPIFAPRTAAAPTPAPAAQEEPEISDLEKILRELDGSAPESAPAEPTHEIPAAPVAPVAPAAAPAPAAPAVPAAPAADEEYEEITTIEQIIDSKPVEEVPKPPRMFNTFYTKNEEFQKLLDKEYQKIIDRGDEVPPAPVYEAPAKAPAAPAEPAADDMSEFEKMLMEGTKSGDLSDATIPIKLSDLKKDVAAELPKEAEEASADTQTKIIGGSAIAVGLAEAAKAEEAPKDPDPQPAVTGMPFAEVSSSIGPDAFVRSTIELKIKELKEQEQSESAIRDLRRKKLEDMRRAREAIFGTETSPQDMEAVREAAEAARTGVKRTDPAKDVKAEPPASVRKEKAPKKKEEPDDYEERRHHPLLTAILIILITAAVFEGGLAALRAYAPDNGVTQVASLVEEAVVNFAKEGIGRAEKFVKGLFNKDSAEPEKLPETAIDSDFNFTSVVEANNRNIEMVVRDANLRRISDVDYGIPGFAGMAGVGSKEVLEAVYGTMIAYNSGWIDYVNDGKQDVLDCLKADGSAYRSALNFDKLGEIKESFSKLALGEVVSDGDTVYVFDEETISVSADGKTSSQTLSWIYELVKVGDEYKIVDYKAN